MKKITYGVFMLLFFSQCQEQSILDEFVEKRCECLKLHNPEIDNFIEVSTCLNEIKALEKYQELGEEEIGKRIKQICPEAELKAK